MKTPNHLAQEQQALLQALFGDRDEQALWPHLYTDAAQRTLMQRGLQAYQSNGLALAERVLVATYPVIAQLLGDENFAVLAHHLWCQQPPHRGDMNCWGDGLAAFLEAAPQLVDEPFLGDVARVEWAMHLAASVADVAANLASFTLLTSGDPTHTTLTLGPGVFLLASGYPVASIINAHLLGEPPLASVAQLLEQNIGEHVHVWRQGFKPRVNPHDRAEHVLLVGLQAGLSLDAALDKTFAIAPGFDFHHWLGPAVQNGLVIGAHSLHTQQGVL